MKLPPKYNLSKLFGNFWQNLSIVLTILNNIYVNKMWIAYVIFDGQYIFSFSVGEFYE